MSRVREVGTLWIGGALSWLERLCLKSFVDRGQKITLFSYHDIPNVPEGVIRRDGREVLETDQFLKYEKKDSFALFADLFRLHMLRACPGMIWVDTDVYCWRPMAYDQDVVMGFELPDSTRVNNAVLGLAPDHPMLTAMLEFTADPWRIPPFVRPALRAEYEAAAAAGKPVHITQQPWGVWGPMMVSHFAQTLGLLDQVQPLAAFYPVTFPDRQTFFRPARQVERLLTPETTALHLWASNKREIGLRHDGVPPAGSFLATLMARHAMSAAEAPIRGRGKRVFEAGLVDRLEIDRVARIADIGGNAQSLVLAAHARWGCAIDLVDVDHKGRFRAEPAPWVAEYSAFLAQNGVPADRLRRVGAPEALLPAEVVVNLSGFGDLNRITPLGPLLDRTLAPGGRVVTDARKGSGAIPWFRGRGLTLTTLSTRDDAGTPVLRLVAAAEVLAGAVAGGVAEATGKAPATTPAPPSAPAPLQAPSKAPARATMRGATGPATRAAPDAPRARAPAAPSAAADEPEDWPDLARHLAGPGGFFRAEGQHSFLYVPRGDTLVVTFDNLDIALTKRADRRPWGYAFIEKQGWSMLGAMAEGWTWYRDPWVPDQFAALAAEGFFARFSRVVFYGASMGGYAACAFVGACPGADVVAISPQSTLERALVPWETRYRTAWGRDFSGPTGDAAVASAAARRVTLLYDPYEPLDAAHANRFAGANVMKLRAPLMGHRLGSSLQQMGILSAVTLGALGGTLTEAEFYRLIRARRGFARYQRELFRRAVERGHLELARRLGRWVLTRGDNRAIRKALAAL